MLNLMPIMTALADSTLSGTGPEKVVGEDIYIVMYVTLLVFGGLLVYLVYLGKQLNALKEKVESDL